MALNKIWGFVKKHKLYFIVGSLFISASTFIALMCVNWTNLKIIYAAGSSAVAPLLESLNKEFVSNNKDSHNINLNVSITGSGNGIEVAANGSKHLGNISRSPRIDEAGAPAISGKSTLNKEEIAPKNGKFSSDWEKRHLKTITIGWDAIGIIYKPANKDSVLNIDSSNIGKVYQLFSGQQEYQLSDLGLEGDNTILKPFARTGGAVKSGTTEAFLTASHLDIDSDEKVQKAINDIQLGTYGSNVSTTKESNIETWMQVKNQGIGTITYLSGGFILSNRKAIEDNGFKIATYNGIDLSEESIHNGYNWYRPFNVIVSINVPEYVKVFINWILFSSDPIIQKIYKEVGIVQLSEKEISSMTINSKNSISITNTDSFWIADDYSLIRQRNEYTYGAI